MAVFLLRVLRKLWNRMIRTLKAFSTWLLVRKDSIAELALLVEAQLKEMHQKYLFQDKGTLAVNRAMWEATYHKDNHTADLHLQDKQ